MQNINRTMKQLKQVLILIITFFSVNLIFAQEIIAEAGSYGIDNKNKIIVWHIKDLDSINAENKSISQVKFNTVLKFENVVKTLSYTETYSVNNGRDYTLYITKLPVVQVTIDDSKINRNNKIPGYFCYYNAGEHIKSTMGVRHRGNLSLTFAKKSFDIEFWNDSITKQKKDLKFKGLRSDDDWILDGMFNEPLRLRSHISAKLWTKVHEPYYSKLEPKAKSGIDIAYVELFKNDEYYGLYQFSESIDRKQLQLKENEGKNIHGELFKANSYKGGPDFTKSPKYNNLFPHWNGWRIEYPFIDYKAEWKDLAKFQDLVVNGSDDLFKNTIENNVHIENVIDYYIFINVVRATDNLGKNYYLAKYNIGEPYFFVAWDLDGVMGIIQDGKQEKYRKDILGNGLFNRLLELNPNDYKTKVKSRWNALKTNEYSYETLLAKVDKLYNEFTKNKIYEREQLVWQNKLNEVSNKEHYEYLKQWLEDRLNILDNYFNSL